MERELAQTDLSSDALLDMLRTMQRIRAFEMAANEASQGGVAAFGQKAAATRAAVRGPLRVSTTNYSSLFVGTPTSDSSANYSARHSCSYQGSCTTADSPANCGACYSCSHESARGTTHKSTNTSTNKSSSPCYACSDRFTDQSSSRPTTVARF